MRAATLLALALLLSASPSHAGPAAMRMMAVMGAPTVSYDVTTFENGVMTPWTSSTGFTIYTGANHTAGGAYSTVDSGAQGTFSELYRTMSTGTGTMEVWVYVSSATQVDLVVGGQTVVSETMASAGWAPLRGQCPAGTDVVVMIRAFNGASAYSIRLDDIRVPIPSTPPQQANVVTDGGIIVTDAGEVVTDTGGV